MSAEPRYRVVWIDDAGHESPRRSEGRKWADVLNDLRCNRESRRERPDWGLMRPGRVERVS